MERWGVRAYLKSLVLVVLGAIVVAVTGLERLEKRGVHAGISARWLADSYTTNFCR
jgi:hypothetical protein